MTDQLRKPWVLVLVAAGLVLAALGLLYVTAPEPTVLTLQVIDAETGEPLVGASVWARSQSEQPLPIVLSDELGMARFDDVPADRDYILRVQQVDYGIAFEAGVVVAEGRETAITVSLSPMVGERLYAGLDGAKVAEIDTASLLVVETIRLPGWKQEPVRHIRTHPNGDLLYTLAGTDGCILDGDSKRTLGQFTLDGTAASLDLKADGQQLYVLSNPAVQSSRTRTASISGPWSGAMSWPGAVPWPGVLSPQPPAPQSGRTITLDFDDESLPATHDLSVFDAFTGELITRTPVAGPRLAPELIWKPGSGAMYAVEPSSRLLWLLEMESQPVLSKVATEPYPSEGLLFSVRGFLHTWVVQYFPTLQATFQEVFRPLLSIPPLPEGSSAWAISPTEEALYVLDAELGTLSILDLVGQEPPTVVAVGKRPAAVALSTDGDWAYVANRESRTISVIYLPTDLVLYSIPVLGEPHSLTVR